MELNECLKIFNLNIDYTKKDLKIKYKKLILIYHPDRNKNSLLNNDEYCKKIITAYHILNKNLENIINKKTEEIIDFRFFFEKGLNIIEKYSKKKLIKKKIIVNIDNLINSDVLVIEIQNEKFYIPMWHHELVFELNSNKKLIIECERELESTIIVDIENNIYKKLFYKLEDFKNKKTLDIKIGKKNFKIEINKLNIQRRQLYIIKNDGILCINEKNIYFEEKKSNIYFDILIMDLL